MSSGSIRPAGSTGTIGEQALPTICASGRYKLYGEAQYSASAFSSRNVRLESISTLSLFIVLFNIFHGCATERTP